MMKMDFNFEGFPSLEAIHANNLEFGFPDIEYTFVTGSQECNDCIHAGRVRKLFFRGNKNKWLNISCEAVAKLNSN